MKFKRIFALVVMLLAVLCIVACSNTETTASTAHTHSFGEWETTKEASCEEKGIQTRKCTCGAEENQDIPAKGHTEVVDKGYDATATENGLTDGSHCGVCNKTITEQKVIYSGSKGLTYIAVSDMTCRIAGIGTCTDTTLVIPEYIDGYKVTSIEPRAFANCTFITAVIVPEHITTIGANAFEGCTNITSITLPFLGATKDESKNANMEYIFGEASERLTTVILTGGTVIGDYAFEGCTGLTSITIPDSVTSIGDDAFNGCTSLTSITIPNSITSITDGAFYGCASLTSITIPESVTSIGYDAFKDCTNLSSVYITDIAAWCNIDFTTLYAIGLKGINNPLQNGAKLYLNNELVTNLTLPNSITSITDGVFYGCTSLTNITIPDSVTSIGQSAFHGCTALKSISIPNSVTSIGDSAFSSCTSLASLTIPNSVTSIAGYAFYGCTGLTSITIPESVTSISMAAFYGCTGLTSITIPESVTSIDIGTFYGCTGLTSITIPDSVTEIGCGAFEGCTGLTSITIPFVGAVKNETNNTHFGYIFGAYSYYENDEYVPENLKSVVITGGLIIQLNAFSGCTKIENIVILDGVFIIGSDVFSDCTGLTSIIIPNSVTKIGSYTFYNCTNLTIYCEAESIPSGWDYYWNYSNCPVQWGYKE